MRNAKKLPLFFEAFLQGDQKPCELMFFFGMRNLRAILFLVCQFKHKRVVRW